MTNYEASYIYHCFVISFAVQSGEALHHEKLLEEVLEKQIPKKPNIYGDGYDDNGNIIYDTYDCPNCHTSYEMEYEKHDYCPNCGQALD